MEKRKQSTSAGSCSNNIKDKTCPICLTQIPNHKAALISNCMHAYCLHCLLRWSHFKRTCPLCNSHFNSYFSSPSSPSSPSSSSSSSSSPSSSPSPCFRKYRLRPLPLLPSTIPHEAPPVQVQRLLRRTMLEVREANRRSRPVPRRRFFGRVGSVPSDAVAERNQRILQWRASIYNKGLSAIPFSIRNRQKLDTSMGKERLLHKIEPWIRRELQAILQDPDPTIIVHVVTALYLSSAEKKTGLSASADNEDAFLTPLRSFLQESTDMFWHELRCFAESDFTMDTYDEVVEYREENRYPK